MKSAGKSMMNSWKEIARYLDVDVRTCQRWEKKYHLPVQRFNDSPKSRVFVYREELDQWLKKKLIKNGIPSRETKRPRKSRITPKGWLVLALIPLFLSLVLVFTSVDGKGTPTGFKINPERLIITGDSGEELWEYRTGNRILLNRKKYQNSFSDKSYNEKNIPVLPLIAIRDINGDGKPEVLFAQSTCNQKESDIFLIFNQSGKILSEIHTGMEITFGDTSYSGDFQLQGFDTADLDGDGKSEILMISNQIPFFPTRFLVLNWKGEKKGEYWNAGRISDLTSCDLDGDGSREILISGINNGYKKGFLAVFDSRRISGASPQEKKHYMGQGLEKGSELYYILFPRTDLDCLDHLLENCVEVKILENRVISARMKHSKNTFIFDSQLRLKNILFSNDFTFNHQKAVSEKRVKSSLDEEYKQNLARNLLYFNGTSWVNKCSRSNSPPGN